jgi:hypothetical protein
MDGFILMCWFWMMGHISGKHLHKKSYTPGEIRYKPYLANDFPHRDHVGVLEATFFEKFL